ncbi:ryncolin-1-like [Strongylocentrotus purpuratus]|uniref:Fibrinogen C-terminal domain-containing protein n=1 Tax=Strongylocentrotus purpuratus TaxID=7668 RepID=A0A7M7P119_STRPU|nr:ryncolin-1-like [Strongylocentrotus purpuratus]
MNRQPPFLAASQFAASRLTSFIVAGLRRDIVTRRPDNVRFWSQDSVHCRSYSSLVVVLSMKVVPIRQRILVFPICRRFAANMFLPRDCAEIQTGGLSHLSGVYPIYPDRAGDDPLFVYCDMETDGGRWTVFQRRQDGSVDFFLFWSNYKHGFGNVSSEHWLGNDNIHRLSRQKTYELRIDLEDFEGHTRYATYSNFSIADEVANYTLALGSYSRDAGM